MSNKDYILTEEIISTIKVIFNEYDKNNNGTIERTEFRKLCEALGERLTQRELDEAMFLLDSNGSGKIEWEEFIEYWANN
jgi:calmodulin